MAKQPLSELALGSFVTSAVKSGQEPEAVGRFLEIQLQSKHPLLSSKLLGEVLASFVEAGFGAEQVGRIVCLEMLAQTPAANYLPAKQPDDQYITKEEFLKTLDLRLASRRDAPAPARVASVTKSLRVKGVSTSVSLTKDTVTEFSELFGSKRLNDLLKDVASKEPAPGQTRSYLAQSAIDDEIRRYRQVVYPHGIKVIKGGSE